MSEIHELNVHGTKPGSEWDRLVRDDLPAHGYWGDALPDLCELEPLDEAEEARRQTDPNGFVYDPLAEQQCVHYYRRAQKAWLESKWHALPEALRSFAWKWLREEVQGFSGVAEWEEVRRTILEPCINA